MKMYIPEIGDHIRLTADWTFKLHAERRNESLGELHGYTHTHGGWVDRELMPTMPTPVVVQYPSENNFKNIFGKIDYEAYRKAQRKAEDDDTAHQKFLVDIKEWHEKVRGLTVNPIKVTLPAGTLLSIDRIYIRKGSSDYSSVTFWVKGFGEVEMKSRYGDSKKKWKSQRFWVKLSDCNKIEFEVEEKPL